MMNYKTLWDSYFAECLGIVAATVLAVVPLYSFIDPKQAKIDRLEANSLQAEKALEASLLGKQEAEQLLEDAQSTISLLKNSSTDLKELKRVRGLLIQAEEDLARSERVQTETEQQLEEAQSAFLALKSSSKDAEKLERVQRLLAKANEDLEISMREKTEAEQRFKEELANLGHTKNSEVDPAVPASWVGTWGGRYLCTSGNRREGLVRWQITNNGNGSFHIDEVAARDNPEPNSYNVQLTGDTLSGLSVNGRYRVTATLLESGVINGDWPGHPCGQIVMAKLF